MISAFNSAIQGLQGFFAKAFWLGIFIPVALFAAIHLGIATLAFPGRVKEAVGGLDATTGWPTVVLGLIVAAFALGPLVPLFRGLLDGSLMPHRLHDRLRLRRMTRARRIRADINKRLNDYGSLRQYAEAGQVLLTASYANAVTLPGAPNDQSILDAEKTLDAVGRLLASGKPVTAERIASVVIGVSDALALNNPEGQLAADSSRAERMRRAAEGLSNFLTEAVDDARNRIDVENARQRGMVVDDVVQATRVGDARRAAERYALDVYGVDFDFLWPRLLTVVSKDSSGIGDYIVGAQAQIDFAVMSLVLSVSIPVAWMPVLLIGRPAWWLVLLVGIAGLALVLFFHLLVVESQLGFGEVVKVAIDRHRLDVLRALCQPLPTSRSAERALWSRLHCAEEDHRVADLAYAKPEAAA